MRHLVLSPIIFVFLISASFGQDLLQLLDSAIADPTKSEVFFRRAKDLIQSEDDQIRYQIARHIHFSSLNNRDSMLHIERDLLPLIDSEGYEVELVKTFQRIGYFYEVTGLYDQAIKYFLDALKVAEKLQDIGLESEIFKSLSQNHRLFHDYAKAVEYGKKSFEVAKKGGDQYLSYQISGLNITGAAFSEMNLPDSTLVYYEKILALTPLTDSLTVAPTIVNIGYAYLLKGDIERSRYFNRLGLNIYKKTNNDYAKGVVYINSAMTENTAKNYLGALAYLDSGLIYTQKSEYAEMYKWIYDEQYKIYKSMGKYPEAMNSLVKLLAIKDSLFEADRAMFAKDLETKYQTALKDREIQEKANELAANKAKFNRVVLIAVLLVVIIGLLVVIHFLNQNRFKKKQQILEKEREIQVRETAIKSALASQEQEKKRFAKDLHDGFGQLITALRMNISGLGDEKRIENKIALFEQAENILSEMHKEIRQIAFDLMPETLVQNGLLPALKEFAHRLSVNGKVQVEVQSFDFDGRLVEIQEISLYRIVQEWCNNVLKYSGANKIEIQIVNDTDELRLTIEDNGNGFDTKVLAHGQGHGWKNIQSRVKLIKGELDIDSNPGATGTILILIFRPISKHLQNQNVERWSKDPA